MPELPEVETVRRGLIEHCINSTIQSVIIRQPILRWPITHHLPQKITNKKIQSVERRGKYLLLNLTKGTLIIHLGMSGVLRIVNRHSPTQKHDHVDIILDNESTIRYNDPRRFGAVLYTSQPINTHPLLYKLGPEPLTNALNGNYIFLTTRKKKCAIKSWLMNNHNLVGVGNIYACEILFLSNLHPNLPAGALNRSDCMMLAKQIKTVLNRAIAAGGTTIKDFKNFEGKPGYFSQTLFVYGRGGMPCRWCYSTLIELKINNRQTVFCENCQLDQS